MSENLLPKARGLIMTKFRTIFQESAISGIPPKKDSHDTVDIFHKIFDSENKVYFPNQRLDPMQIILSFL